MGNQNDIYKREAQFYQRRLTQPRYCSFCGKQLMITTDEEDSKYEWQQGAHIKCAEAFYAQKMRELQNGN